MNESNNRSYLIVSHTITILFVVQVILSIIFYNWYGIDLLTYAGWITIISGIIIFYKALVQFRKNNKMDKVNKIVDTGLFSIVRHPMYLAFILMTIGLIFISQYWLIIIIGLIRILMFYYVILEEEKMVIEELGNDYCNYQKKVPRLNFIKGILRKTFKP